MKQVEKDAGITGDEFNPKVEKFFQDSSAISLAKPEFLREHEESSDSEEDEEEKEKLKGVVKDLALLKVEAGNIERSKFIWNRLGLHVKYVVSSEGEPEDSNFNELANNESKVYQSFEDSGVVSFSPKL